jgi:hypothetical protein
MYTLQPRPLAARLKWLQKKVLFPTIVVVNSFGNLRINSTSPCLKFCSAILLLCAIASVLLAQTAVPVASPSLTPLSSSDDFLRGQLSSLNSLHDSLISTVHWALGVAFGIAIVLVTYNWLVTARNIARDKEALRQELKGMFEAAEAESHEHLSRQFEKTRADMIASLEQSTKIAVTGLEQKIKRQETQLDSLRKDINSEFASIRCNLLVTEARYWNSRGVRGNEFSTYLQLLQLAHRDVQLSSFVNTALGEILRLVPDPATSYFTSEVAELTTALDRLPTQYTAIVGAVKEALSKKIAAKPPI